MAPLRARWKASVPPATNPAGPSRGRIRGRRYRCLPSCPERSHNRSARCCRRTCRLDGYLWDLDSGGPGEPLTIGGDGPCPVCNKEEWLESVMENEEFDTEADALAYRDAIIDKYLD